MSDNKKLPQCDCINDCGDDDNVAKGLRQRCSRYDEIQAENLDNQALRLLSNAMRSKLAASRRKGRSGWNDKTQCTVEHLSQLLREHVEKGDPVDVANFCAFLAARGEGIAPQAAPITAAAPGEWQELAARVMDALANAQDRTNAAYPEHVKCYPSWETKPRHLRWLAEMFRTGKPIGNGAGQPDVLAALSAKPTAAPAEGFELWWEDHMPSATQAEAWAAWGALHNDSAAAAPEVPRYRLLNAGEPIQPDDEFIDDDGVTWNRPVGWEVGMKYSNYLKSGRRRVAPAIAASEPAQGMQQ